MYGLKSALANKQIETRNNEYTKAIKQGNEAYLRTELIPNHIINPPTILSSNPSRFQQSGKDQLSFKPMGQVLSI